MKVLNTKTLKVFGLLLLIMAGSACKNNDVISPADSASSLTGTIDGKALSINQAALSSTFYSSSGDNVNSMQTTATVNTSGDALTFFIPDLSVAENTITPKLGTASTGGDTKLKVEATTTTTIVQAYIAYKSGSVTYYAISGTVSVTTDNTKVTVKWNLTFTDSTGRTFKSEGSFVIYNYKTVTKPKTEITDPTPIAPQPTIANMTPTSGAAGDSVVITGTNFSTAPADDVVKFNGVAGTIRSASATRLVVTVPANGSSGVVTVKVKNSETTKGPEFSYVSPPTISGITPLTGKAGTVMTIVGSNFSTTLSDDVVTINGMAAVTLTSSVDRMTVTVPQGVTSGAIVLKVRGKVATANAGIGTTFTVTL